LLPPTRSLDLAIDIQAAKEPPLWPCYAFSQKELSLLMEYIKEILD
jgi:hypothetical protein